MKSIGEANLAFSPCRLGAEWGGLGVIRSF